MNLRTSYNIERYMLVLELVSVLIAVVERIAEKVKLLEDRRSEIGRSVAKRKAFFPHFIFWLHIYKIRSISDLQMI